MDHLPYHEEDLTDEQVREFKRIAVGKQYAYFKVIRRLPDTRYERGGKRSVWVCKCVCGRLVEVNEMSLKNRSLKSCGCRVMKKAHKEAEMFDLKWVDKSANPSYRKRHLDQLPQQ